jgi:hypothetical protein
MPKSTMRSRGGRSLAAAGLLAWLAAGCAITSTARTTTEVTVSGPDGALTIECRSDGAIDGDACVDWGDRVRETLSSDASDAIRIVLTDRQGAGRCLADFHDADGVLYASASVDCP